DRCRRGTTKPAAAPPTIPRHAQRKSPPVQTATGQPIFVITSTGRKGNDNRTVVSEVIRKPFDPDIKAALVTDVDTRFSGNCIVCGYNHQLLTPLWYGENGRGRVTRFGPP